MTKIITIPGARPQFIKAAPVSRALRSADGVQENVLLMGNPGTGKTHLTTALGHSACAQGKHARFFSVTGLVTQLLEARQQRQLE